MLPVCFSRQIAEFLKFIRNEVFIENSIYINIVDLFQICILELCIVYFRITLHDAICNRDYYSLYKLCITI